nr:hypothetical transcript [Hymenolepis microstoma]
MTRLKRNSNRRKRSCQGEPQLLQILQWDAGGMPQDKKIQNQPTFPLLHIGEYNRKNFERSNKVCGIEFGGLLNISYIDKAIICGVLYHIKTVQRLQTI